MNRLFVIMPFGIKKTKRSRPGTISRGAKYLDFDLVYNELIRRSANAAGFEAVRIDELVEPGQITHQYLKELLEADVVLADISLPNANVFYELGIRQAISTGSSILIALDGSEIPFDLSSQRVFFYDLSDEALKRATGVLTEALFSQKKEISKNPIRSFLEQIAAVSNPATDYAAFEQELQGRIQRAQNREQLISVWRWSRNFAPLPPFTLLSLAKRLSDFNEWRESVEVLKAAVVLRPKDFELHRELGWHFSKLGVDYVDEAIKSFERALALNPDDPEALGMIAGVFKRNGDYDKAAEYYSKGLTISPNDLYMLVNQAAMHIFLEPHNPTKGIELYRKLIKKIGESESPADEWQEIVLGEAYFVVDDIQMAKTHFSAANGLAASPKSLRSAADQIELFGKAGFNTKNAFFLAKWLRSIAKEIVEVSERSPDHKATGEKLPVLLHLSDIHFGGIAKDGKTKNMHRFYEGEYSKRLSRHIIDEFTARKAHFTHDRSLLHLLVSGDITYTATKEEFQLAQEFLNEVCDGLNINKKRVHLVPGNHDVDWKRASIDLSHRFDNYIQFLVDFYEEDLFRAKHPKIAWDLKINSDRPKPWEILSFQQDPELKLTVFGLNSCIYETDQNHYGVIGGRQLRLIEELFEQLDESTDGVRVAMFHHHLHPFPEFIQKDANSQVDIDLSIIRDSGIVERQLERMNFDLILHGHKHKAQIRETAIKNAPNSGLENAKLIVCGAGSAGVNYVELEHNTPNQYQVIEILRSPRRRAVDFLKIEWRTLDVSDEAEWITPGSWIITG
jgi:tetratricopeptide (TPR) repeat protein